MPAPRLGSQKPTFSTVGGWAYTDGPEAVALFEHYGVRFYDSQKDEMDAFLARGEDGSFAAKTEAVSKPRQNGKSYAARFYALWMAAIEGKRVLFSAHHGKTVRKMFKELRSFVEGTPDFAAMLLPNGKGVYSAAGSEGIYFAGEDGAPEGLIEFQTRTNSAARGETYQVIVVDEAQELTDEQLEALKPTTLAASDASDADSDPQTIYLGTPPGPKCPGTVFRDLHDRAHAGEGGGAWWTEWAVDDVPDLSDRGAALELAYLTNPAMGHRIKESTMLDMMDSMRADGFARECLGWWPKGAQGGCIAPPAWDALRVETGEGLAERQKGWKLALGVKFSADGSSGSVAVALWRKGEPAHVEALACEPTDGGIGWAVDLAEAMARKACAIVFDGKANAQDFHARLLERGAPKKALHPAAPADVTAASSMLLNAAQEGALTHTGQPALDAAALHALKREIGKGGGFGFRSADGTDITPLEAAALALWGARTSKRDPNRKQRVG